MDKKIIPAIAIVATSLAALGGRAISAQDRYTLEVPGGLAFADFRGYEDWQTVAVSQNGQTIETILGNPAMIEAYKSGIPGNGKPFPDGAKFAKIHWNARKADDEPGEPLVPGVLHDIDFMQKDSKKFADSGGWGYAEFEYDAASDAFRPGDENDTPPQDHDVRVRLPHDRGGEGLRVHRLPEAVNGEEDPHPAFRAGVQPSRPRSRSIEIAPGPSAMMASAIVAQGRWKFCQPSG